MEGRPSVIQEAAHKDPESAGALILTPSLQNCERGRPAVLHLVRGTLLQQFAQTETVRKFLAHIKSPRKPELKFFTMLQGSKNKIKEVMLYRSIRGVMENHLGFHQK